MRLRVYYDHWLPKLFKFAGLTIYPFVMLAGAKDAPGTATVARHECIHVRQVRREGLFLFALKYFVELVSLLARGRTYDQAIHEVSFEKEAYADQDKIEMTHEERTDFAL